MKVEIEYNLTGSAVPDYSMYTELGNAAVHAIVVAARDNDLTWAQTYRALSELARQKEFGEATDTAVRESVYDALEYYEKEQDFWV
jgi:2-methylisocitrate lyase-like PEP mutase family enzyme